MTAAELTTGARLQGDLVRAPDFEPLPAVVADCRPEEHDGAVEMHVWWTVGGDCWYPLDADLPVLEVL